MLKKIVLVATAWSLMVSVAWADEVTDEIDRASRSYQLGEIKEAMAMLDVAIGKMNKKRDAYFLSSFPEPIAGWTAGEAVANPLAASMLGDGSSILSRVYFKETGERMEMDIMSGSGLTRAASDITNSSIVKAATALSGKKIDNIRGFQVKTKMKKGKKRITLLVGSVMVSAKSKDVPEEEMRAYLALLPLEEF